MEQGLWFLGGAITYSVIAKLLQYVQLVKFVDDITTQILKLLGCVAEDVAFAKALKFKALEESDFTEEQIQSVKQVDEMAFINWKAMTIIKIVDTYPKQMKHLLPFYDWDSAMKALTDIYIKEARKSVKRKK